MIDTLVDDIDVIKRCSWCQDESTEPPPSLPPLPTPHPQNDQGDHNVAQNHGSVSPDFSEELFLRAFCDVEELDKDDEGELSSLNSEEAKEDPPSAMRPEPALVSSTSVRNHENYLRRKRRRSLYDSSSTESLGLSTVHMNPAFSESRSNPYLASTSNPIQISSMNSFPLFDSNEIWRDSISRTNSSQLTHTERSHEQQNPFSSSETDQRIRRMSPHSWAAKGLIKQDTDSKLYTPYSVQLAPLAHSPKAKKHHLLRLLEPDIGQSPSAEPHSPSCSIHHIPSILLRLGELDKREKLILLALQHAHQY
jgi:hypothetical protein